MPDGTEASAPNPRIRVLFVEHDHAILEAIAPALREGFEVWVARNSAEGLEVGQEVGYRTDVLVIDMAFRRDFAGDSFIAEFRRRAGREVPVIIVSGVPTGYALARSTRGAILLPAPINVLELIRTIRSLTRPLKRPKHRDTGRDN